MRKHNPKKIAAGIASDCKIKKAKHKSIHSTSKFLCVCGGGELISIGIVKHVYIVVTSGNLFG